MPVAAEVAPAESEQDAAAEGVPEAAVEAVPEAVSEPATKRKAGRPPGSKNKPKDLEPVPKRKVCRPVGSCTQKSELELALESGSLASAPVELSTATSQESDIGAEWRNAEGSHLAESSSALAKPRVAAFDRQLNVDAERPTADGRDLARLSNALAEPNAATEGCVAAEQEHAKGKPELYEVVDENAEVSDGVSGSFPEVPCPEAAASELPEGTVHLFLHRTETAWVITPLAGRCEVRLHPPSIDGLPPADCSGVIWCLDEHVFQNSGDSDEEQPWRASRQSVAQSVAKRLKKVSSGMKKLKSVADKLQAKLSKHQEDLLQLRADKHHLRDAQAKLHEDNAKARVERRRLEEYREKLQQQQAELDSNNLTAAQQISESLRVTVKVGGAAAVPPEIFFAAAHEEFIGAQPNLEQADQEELESMRITPEAAFTHSRMLFWGKDASVSLLSNQEAPSTCIRAASFAHALLAMQGLLDTKEVLGRVCLVVEQLFVMAQTLTRDANVSGRYPLSFAAACCSVWCGLFLIEHIGQRWAEVKPSDLLEELRAEAPLGMASVLRRTKCLVQQGETMKRVLHSLEDYWAHRRRFIRCLASRGTDGASEADLRLLFLPRDARPSELAAHVKRLSNFVHDTSLPSLRSKRPLPTKESDMPLAKRSSSDSLSCKESAPKHQKPSPEQLPKPKAPKVATDAEITQATVGSACMNAPSAVPVVELIESD